MSESEKRSFFELPATERHRRLLAHHESHSISRFQKATYSTSGSSGFFSTEEEKEISQAHKFIRSEDDEITNGDNWATRLAKKYYRRLFKEYCIVDLSLYEYGCLGTRWRTKEEVLEGKGQFICAAKHCGKTEELQTFEVNFSYSEDGVKKQALVKVRLCPECMTKMNYRRTVLKERVEKALYKRTKRKRNKRSSKVKKKSKATNFNEKQESSKELPIMEESDDIEECLDDLLL
eukprot:g4720.t1